MTGVKHMMENCLQMWENSRWDSDFHSVPTSWTFGNNKQDSNDVHIIRLLVSDGLLLLREILQAAITARRRLEEEEDNYSEALKSAYIVIFPPQISKLHHLENLLGAIMQELLCFYC